MNIGCFITRSFTLLPLVEGIDDPSLVDTSASISCCIFIVSAERNRRHRTAIDRGMGAIKTLSVDKKGTIT